MSKRGRTHTHTRKLYCSDALLSARRHALSSTQAAAALRPVYTLLSHAHTHETPPTHTLIFTLTFTHNVCSLRVQVRRALSFWVRSNNSVPPSCMHALPLPFSPLHAHALCTPTLLHHSAQRHTHWQLRTPTHVSALSLLVHGHAFRLSAILLRAAASSTSTS